MRKFVQTLCGVMSAGVLVLLALVIYVQATLPDNFYIAKGEDFVINSRLSISANYNVFGETKKTFDPKVYDKAGNSYNININLFENIPIKQVQVQVIERTMVVPCGTPFGIKMFTNGVMIVGMSDIQIGTQNLNPAKNAGLKIGDIITDIDDKEVFINTDVAKIISQSDGAEMKFSLIRSNRSIVLYLNPIKSEFDKSYKAGIWVRDSSAGIGTMTYYHPDSLEFAGLGHAVCDVDTGNIMPLLKGEIVDVNISDIHAGQSGKPGELKGVFIGSNPLGRLTSNSETGIFGILEQPFISLDPIPMALKQEVQPGPAQILSTISGNKPQSFDIVIEKVNYSDVNTTKNMVVKIVDEKLLTATGGIVQGMSGSPIIQDGKLVGAVTHVFVNDPTRGYGIFAENMDNFLNSVEKDNKSA